MKITGVEGLEILDSRCRPTVEAVVRLAGGVAGRASVPSGASTGQHEALELRDGNDQRYGGFGVQRAVDHVNGDIADALNGMNADDQPAVDDRLCALDGTKDKSRLGGNALLAVSAACVRAAAAAQGRPLWRRFAELARAAGIRNEPCLPLSMINLLSGGKHAGGRVDFQDFLIVPRKAKTVDDVTMIAYRVWYACRSILQEEGAYTQLVADEGGLGPDLDSNEAMMQLGLRAIERAGYVPGREVSLAIDVAASHFYRDGRYALANEDRQLSPDEMIDRLAEWVEHYPLISIEDGLDENDWSGWRALTERLGTVQLLGDDLFTTDADRLQHGIDQGIANSILIKPNQIGTITETMRAICLAQANGYRCVVSTRSGETEDAWIVDLAVGTGAGQLKPGSITRSERLAKFNRLRRITADTPELPLADPFGSHSR